MERKNKFGNVVIFLTSVLAGCSPGLVNTGRELRDPRAAIKMVNGYDESISSCRRIFSIEAKRSLGVLRGEGILLYINPSRFRLEAWNERGNLIFHYIENNGEYELHIPRTSEQVFSLDESNDELVSTTGFTLGELKNIGLSSFSIPDEEFQYARGLTGEVVVSQVTENGHVTKQWSFDELTGAPSHFKVSKDRRTLREVSFENTKNVQNLPRPTEIEIVDHEHSTTVKLIVQQESINHYVPDSLFFLSEVGR